MDVWTRRLPSSQMLLKILRENAHPVKQQQQQQQQL